MSAIHSPTFREAGSRSMLNGRPGKWVVATTRTTGTAVFRCRFNLNGQDAAFQTALRFKGRNVNDVMREVHKAFMEFVERISAEQLLLAVEEAINA